MSLAQIFDTYHLSGDYVNGNSYLIEIQSPDPSPINYQDFAMMLDAEAYLLQEGYITGNRESQEV